MKTLKPQKRSVSPFGLIEEERGPFEDLKDLFASKIKKSKDKKIKKLEHWDQASFIPEWIEKAHDAAANDSPQLINLCDYLARYRKELEEQTLWHHVFEAMNLVFERKTELFLIDHHDEESCKKMEWDTDHKDFVLFAKERNALVGNFFGKVTERTPGEFSHFVEKWVQSDSPDRLLHFIDFCAGAKDPTFEHFLLFTHPTLKRISSNKDQLRDIFKSTETVLSRLSSPTWETDTRKTLEI